MRWFFFGSLILSSCASQRGLFVDRGLYNNSPFVTATAKSPTEARARAEAAIPVGFEVDSEFREPVLSCGSPGEMSVGESCASGLYRVDLALLPAAGEEREAILHTRRDLASMQESRP